MPNSESQPAPPWSPLFFCLLSALNRSRDARVVWYEQINARLSEENRRLSRELELAQQRRAA
jgi:hypothetical protein